MASSSTTNVAENKKMTYKSNIFGRRKRNPINSKKYDLNSNDIDNSKNDIETQNDIDIPKENSFAKKGDVFDPPTDESDEELIKSDDKLTDNETSDYDEDEDDNELDEREQELKAFINEKSLESRNKEVTFKVDLTLPRFGVMFYTEVIKLALLLQVILVAFLVGTGIIEINNYLYLIFDSVFTLLICGFNLIYLFIYNMRNPNLAYDHIGTLWSSAVFTALAMLLVWFTLGRWCYVYATCCDFSTSQPIPGDLPNYVRFYGAYVTQLIFPAIVLAIYTPRVFTALMYPLTNAATNKKKN